MITRTRRRLLLASRALREEGILPPGAEDGSVYRPARSGYVITDSIPDDEKAWRELYARLLAEAVRAPNTQPLRAAE
jgi:hypothetical protein